MEEQSQLPQYLVEERWRFRLLTPEEAGQHGEGGTLNPSNQRVEPCLDESVGPDVPTEGPLARDVAELLEGVIAGHRSLLGRRLGEEGSHIRRRCCIAFLFEPTTLTHDLSRRQLPTTSVSTQERRHTRPLICDFKLADPP
jgi:hypothetical protein